MVSYRIAEWGEAFSLKLGRRWAPRVRVSRQLKTDLRMGIVPILPCVVRMRPVSMTGPSRLTLSCPVLNLVRVPRSTRPLVVGVGQLIISPKRKWLSRVLGRGQAFLNLRGPRAVII